MQLFFAGAEVTSHFAILHECGVERVAVSASNLARVAKEKLPLWASRARLAGLEWVLYADSDQTPVSTVTSVLSGAEVQPEAVAGPIEWYDTTWLKDSDLQFLPTWDGNDPARLREYAEDFSGVMLPGRRRRQSLPCPCGQGGATDPGDPGGADRAHQGPGALRHALLVRPGGPSRSTARRRYGPATASCASTPTTSSPSVRSTPTPCRPWAATWTACWPTIPARCCAWRCAPGSSWRSTWPPVVSPRWPPGSR